MKAELLITMFIFSFLMVVMFTIMKMGSNGWRDVQDKGDVQRSLRHFEADITQELRAALQEIRHPEEIEPPDRVSEEFAEIAKVIS